MCDGDKFEEGAAQSDKKKGIRLTAQQYPTSRDQKPIQPEEQPRISLGLVRYPCRRRESLAFVVRRTSRKGFSALLARERL